MNPAGYRVTNLFLHVVNALLIWTILRKLSIPGGFLAALLFAVHPVNVESVAWIAQRKNLLALFFFLISVDCFLRWKSDSDAATQRSVGQAKWYWLSVAAFLLAMLSKGTVAIEPLVLLLIVWWQRGKVGLKELRATLPFFLIAISLTAVNLWFRSHGTHVEIRSADLAERLIGAGAAIWFYLSKALFPINLTFIYPNWQLYAGAWMWWIPLIAALIATTILFWRRNTTWGRALLFAWSFYCIALLPVLGFVDVGFMQFSLVADHYQQIALISVVSLVSATLITLRQRLADRYSMLVLGVSVVLVAELAFMTSQRARLFSEPQALYASTLDRNPDSWPVRNDLGNLLLADGDFQGATEQFAKALESNPNLFEAHNNLGNALVATEKTDEAVKEYQEALRLNPAYLPAHYNLALQMLKLQRSAEAIDHLLVVLKYDPYDAQACFNLAQAQAMALRPDLAVQAATKALQIARTQKQNELASQIEAWLREQNH
jgi:tetratricopeptide (TPR) repeat protein